MLARLRRRRRVRRLATTAAALIVAWTLTLLLALPAAADQVRDTELWVLNALNVQQAWASTKGQGVTVAVIDSGVDPDVSDLTGSVRTGPDFTGVDTPSDNPNWGVHGTWMASLIVGHGNGPGDSSGIIGVAPGAKVLSIRVITDQQDPNFEKYEHEKAQKGQDELAEAITYAVNHRASVISMSLGYSLPSGVVRAALQYAYIHKVVVVASAGNSGGQATAQTQAPYSFPADYPGVLAVGAVNRAGQPASFSSQNLSVQVVAPGSRVPAQGRDGNYWLVSGTSPACALTAGVVALIKSKYPQLADQAVISAITSSTTRSSRPAGGYDDTVGFGEVNAGAALAAAARLARPAREVSSVASTAHFGGGVAAIPAAPVRSRGLLPLMLYCLLGAAALALVAAATFRLFSLREAADGEDEPLPEPTAVSSRPWITASPAGKHAASRGRGDPGPGARSTDDDHDDARSAPERSGSERGGEW
jgi:subtilisin family serine protease